MPDEIERLRTQVKAADEEFHKALAFHEAWKPAAYDEGLHERLGTSYATRTFNVISAALRREVLLALTRLWDKDSHALRMEEIARILGKRHIIEALMADVARDWEQPRDPYNVAELPQQERAQVLEAMRLHEAAFGQEQAEIQRGRIGEAVLLIRKYVQGEGKDTLKRLRDLRNKQLAHRQIVDRAPAAPELGGATDQEVENLYQDMTTLIRLLKGAVERTSYNLDDTAQIHAKNAKLFWAGVRGDRTEGHPSYQPPPALP